MNLEDFLYAIGPVFIPILGFFIIFIYIISSKKYGGNLLLDAPWTVMFIISVVAELTILPIWVALNTLPKESETYENIAEVSGSLALYLNFLLFLICLVGSIKKRKLKKSNKKTEINNKNHEKYCTFFRNIFFVLLLTGHIIMSIFIFIIFFGIILFIKTSGENVYLEMPWNKILII